MGTLVVTYDYDYHATKHEPENREGVDPIFEVIGLFYPSAIDFERINPFDGGEVFLGNDEIRLKIFDDGEYVIYYRIELAGIDSPMKAYQKLAHLIENHWITRAMLNQFLAVLQKRFKYGPHEVAPVAKIIETWTAPFDEEAIRQFGINVVASMREEEEDWGCVGDLYIQ